MSRQIALVCGEEKERLIEEACKIPNVAMPVGIFQCLLQSCERAAAVEMDYGIVGQPIMIAGQGICVYIYSLVNFLYIYLVKLIFIHIYYIHVCIYIE